MCEHCEKATSERGWDQLEQIDIADAMFKGWLTRCPVCLQLWETYAYEPQISWELTIREAEEKFPNGSFCGCPSIHFQPAWLTPIVKALAEQIYNDRAFDVMPILGDALEEAGCTVTDVLEHCRSAGEHCRGCWVIAKVRGET
jgi:hypothetical protein